MPEELKKHKSIKEQVNRLESRGLIFENKDIAEKFLNNVNYYRLSGYLHDFKDSEEKYSQGLTFEKIVRIYEFDCKFSRILMYALEDIEESLKTKFSYMLSSSKPDDPCVYLDKSIYRDTGQFSKFVSLFNTAKKNNEGLPFIKHHNKKYGGQLPVWVAVEIMTLGNIDALYQNLLPYYQKKLAKEYKTGPVQLANWIMNLRYTRNHLAHYMRIYNYNFGRTSKECRNHKVFNHTGRIFDQIAIMSYLFSDNNDWNTYVLVEMGRIIDEYKDILELEKIGFDEDWEEQLRI